MNKSLRITLSLILLAVGVAVGLYGPRYLPASWFGAGQGANSSVAVAPAGRAAAPAPRRALPVELAVVESVSFPRGISAIGSLRSNESTMISAEIAGRVAEINFTEGQPVRKGQVLVQLDDDVVQAELGQAQANLALAQSRFDRSNRLQNAGFVSKEAREDAQNQLKLQQAAFELAKAKFDKTRILAPFDGVIGLREVSLGQYVTAGQDIAPLEDTAVLKVEFRLPERFVADVVVGQTLEFSVDARAGQIFEGKVYAISPLIEQAGRSILVRAKVDNSAGLLNPGMFARVQLITQESMAVVVPEAAMSPSGQTQYVYKVTEGQAQRIAVQMGERRGGLVEIISGLEPGDLVIVAGLQSVRNAAPVQPLSDPKSASDVAKEAQQSAQSLRVNPS
jgi:membrane fusion protein, multidrug efflux system